MDCNITPERFAMMIKAKSDQINAIDLTRPIVARIVRIKELNDDKQPMGIWLDTQKQPWKPCLGQRRLLGLAWGDDPNVWLGRLVRIYREPSVRFGKGPVGGIRVSGLSHIKETMRYNLAISKGATAEHVVEPLVLSFRDRVIDMVKSGECTQEQAVAALGGRKAGDVPEAEHAAILQRLQAVQQTVPDADVDAAGGEE